ncbi:MAG: Stp1/IreP family PP2C-type Ser/Thr phosphatase [Vallitaleaceae bacterium]|nr:Stp1/IreP family PP2C-type Ser/Thr phosphatase [Vallitaleaceae bacterium]
MKIFGKTHIGLVREINEDNLFLSRESIGKLPNLFIIADGMGGHKAGEVASLLAVESFVKFCKGASSELSIEEIFIKATQFANNVIYDQSIHTVDMSGMGTTLVACTLSEDVLYVCNVGDSRLYVLENDLKQISIDHSFVEELVRAGEITREESYHHPAKNKITRALGVGSDIVVDIFKLKFKDLGKILLCSDGLTNMLTDYQMSKILRTNEPISLQGETLLNEALSQGGHDNITIILLEQTN